MEPTENSSKKVQLSEMPKEILEEILIYLDDKSLLNASHVCKLFASVAETAFARKYSKEYYGINGSLIDTEFGKVMVNKYGGKMQHIEIIGGDEELYHLVEQKCGNLKSLFLDDVSRMIMLKDLKEVYLGFVRNLDHETLAEFFNDNRQLETLELVDQPEIDLTDILDGRLNVLKELELCRIRNITGLPQIIRIDSLKTLWLGLENSESYVRILRALNCNKIKTLILDYDDDQDEGADVITEICKFKTLVSLDLSPYHITSDEVKKLATHLPDLAEIDTGMTKDESNPENMIQSMISMLPRLTKFTATLDGDDFNQIVRELKSPCKKFHARFAKSNIEIVLWGHPSVSMVSITTDCFYIKYGNGPFELHWMNNMNEESVRTVMAQRRWLTGVTFINSCTDRAFDIPTLAYMRPYYTDSVFGIKYLHFKSNGPISVNSNVSEIHAFVTAKISFFNINANISFFEKISGFALS